MTASGSRKTFREDRASKPDGETLSRATPPSLGIWGLGCYCPANRVSHPPEFTDDRAHLRQHPQLLHRGPYRPREVDPGRPPDPDHWRPLGPRDDRAEIGRSTRLNSSHANISYAVFCLKKKNTH